jgi:hypothetical protein
MLQAHERGFEVRQRPGRGARAYAVVFLAVTAVLLLPAAYNRFPMVFPDTGAYLLVGYGGHWTIDRSGFYGLLYQPILRPSGTSLGLWMAIAVQAAIIAGVLLLSVRRLAPSASSALVFLLIAAAAALTSLPWHAAQLMPDAFTGALILSVWLAASRNIDAPGTPLAWLLTVVLALTHYTHLVLVAAAGVAVLAGMTMSVPWKEITKRALALTIALSVIASAHVAANGLLLGRWTISPLGSWFLFARLNEDGLVPRWFDAHCGKDAPRPLCEMRPVLPRDSQILLWSGNSPLNRYIHKERGSPVTWQWVDMMSQAVSGSIREQPFAFVATVGKGAASQFVTFQTLDDQCPVDCRSPRLIPDRPQALAELTQSRQLRGEIPKNAIRAVHTPVAVIGLALLPVLLIFAWRRRDAIATSLLAAVAVGLVANAALGGGLSDVHDRYQSRVVWLAPFVSLLLMARWRQELPYSRSKSATGGQHRSRSATVYRRRNGPSALKHRDSS